MHIKTVAILLIAARPVLTTETIATGVRTQVNAQNGTGTYIRTVREANISTDNVTLTELASLSRYPLFCFFCWSP